MNNDKWKGRKKVHEWNFMGHSKDGKLEYCMCSHCNKIGYWGDKGDEITYITWKQYDDLDNSGQIVHD